MQVLLISATLLGLGGSLHCLGMCGPLILKLHQGTGLSKSWHSLVYHLSRALTYGLMGLLIGMVGKGLYLMNIQQYLSILAGIVLIVLLIWPHLKSTRIPSPLRNFNARNFTKFTRLPSSIKFPALGMLNALLPCGLVYTAIGVSLVSASSPLDGFLFMFVFGLGTLPALWSISLLGSKFSLSRIRSARWLVNTFTLVVAVMLILRGMNLGIQYLSPKQNTEQTTMDACCQESDGE